MCRLVQSVKNPIVCGPQLAIACMADLCDSAQQTDLNEYVWQTISSDMAIVGVVSHFANRKCTTNKGVL